MHVVNNRETHADDAVFYIDEDKQIHDATVKNIYEKEGNHFADLRVEKDGKHVDVKNVPHNTSPEAHSWNHPRSREEVTWHNEPDFYGGEK